MKDFFSNNYYVIAIIINNNTSYGYVAQFVSRPACEMPRIHIVEALTGKKTSFLL